MSEGLQYKMLKLKKKFKKATLFKNSEIQLIKVVPDTIFCQVFLLCCFTEKSGNNKNKETIISEANFRKENSFHPTKVNSTVNENTFQQKGAILLLKDEGKMCI